MKKRLVYTDRRSGHRFYPAPVEATWALCEVSIVLNDRVLMQEHFLGVSFQQRRPRQSICSLGFMSLS